MVDVSDLPVRRFEARDGTSLAFREIGEGRPLVLIHGFFSTAVVNWIRPGHAAALAAAGHRVVMPDLRAHGASARPHDPASYPPDVLADDGLALLDHLGFRDYDLGGYSLGARTVARMLVRGATPGRAVAAGMGLDSIVDPHASNERFRHILTNLGSFEQGSSEWMAERFLRSNDGDPTALLHLLDSAVVTAEVELALVETPTLVVVGREDPERSSADRLAVVLPDARLEVVPGNHMSAVAKPDLAAVIAAFLAPSAGD